MSEIQYIWADPDRPQQQVALSSLVQAMSIEEGKKRKPLMAIARWVSRDGMDPKMGVLMPTMFEEVHCFLWAQVSDLEAASNVAFEFNCLSLARCHLQMM